jgi:C4-dicarboxylate-specific signal transduction histidine kinase
VAHELNNPLNNIGLYVGNVLDQLELGVDNRERMVHNLSQVMRQVAKATEIINHLRTFGRAAPVSREAVSVNEVVVNALSLLREQMRLREIEVDLRLSPEAPVVVANAIQMEQVFMNLLTNARDALAGSQRRLIRVTTTAGASEVRVDVDDSGPGIAADLAERIFDPFFTTKDVGAGTGLGLSIVYGIIKDHEGSITLEESEAGGARFVVRLPRAVS